MKYLKYSILILISVFTLASCKTDFDTVQVAAKDQVVAPELHTIDDIIITGTNQKVESVSYKWTDVDFKAQVSVQYDLMAEYGDMTAQLGSSFSDSISISKKTINDICIDELGIAGGSSTEISTYLLAYVTGTRSDTIKSNVITYNVQLASATKKRMYITGRYANYDIDNAQEFLEVDAGSNIFQILLDLSVPSTHKDYPNSYFKVMKDAPDWDNAIAPSVLIPQWTMKDPTNSSKFSVDASVDSSAVRITIDMNTSTMSIKRFHQLGVMGSFNGWTDDAVLTFNNDDNVWSTEPLTFDDAGKFKFRMDGSYDVAFGGPLENSKDIDGGKVLTKTSSIKLSDMGLSAGTYIIKLYTNVTPYVLVMEQQ